MTKKEIYNLLIKPKSEGGMNQIQEKGFSLKFPDIYIEYIKLNYPSGFSFKQKLYHFLLDDFSFEIGLCKQCGKRCAFKNMKKGYFDFCSNTCVQKYKPVQEKIKQTNIKRYGSENPMQNKTVQEKVKNTNITRYGSENPLQNKTVQEKAKNTNIKRYGSENPMQNKAVQEKAKNTNLKRYGSEIPMLNKEIKEKIKQTNLEKYGVENVFQSKEIKEKTKQTNLEKYGAEYANQSKEIKEKTKQTNFKKYGVEYVIQSKEIKEKVKKTNLEKYGVEIPSQSDEIKEKIKQTNLERYGVTCSLQSDETKEKVKKTNLEKYGVEIPSQSDEIKEKIKQTNLERYGVACSLHSDEIKEKVKQTNLERYNVPYACMRPEAMVHPNNSKPNIEFSKLLDENNISYEREFRLENYSYDFKIDNILIEINPTITHNSFLNIFNDKPKENDYHLNKSITAETNGFRCIHIFDWDNIDKILNILKPKEILYARNLELKQLNIKDCNEFLNAYHLQNTCKGQKICLGLYISNILVEVMTFGIPRYNKNYEWELLRLCSHKDYKIVGGAERLFKYFVKTYNPKSIISYCDNSKFSGGVYQKLGFKNKQLSKPAKHWYNLKTKRHITDNFLRQRGFDQLFNTNYGKGTSNEDLMLDYGFLPVYDCGQFIFIFE